MKSLILIFLGSILGPGVLSTLAADKTKTITLQQGLGDYEGVEDTWISDLYRAKSDSGEADANKSFGGMEQLCIHERGPIGENARALIRFDLSGVKGKIVAAELVLTKATQSPNGSNFFNETIAVYPISDANKGWRAGDARYKAQDGVAVWNQREDPSTPWAGEAGLSSVGVDFLDEPVAEAETGYVLKTPISFPFSNVSILNEWAEHPEKNAGFLLREIHPLASGGDHFYSSESNGENEANRPKLILTVVTQ